VFVIAAVWLLAHLASLSPALEDIDSINFALGLHHYDPALHQPHPPGYPVFIAVGRIALAVIHLVAPGISYVRADALALAIWSAIGGAIAIVAAGFLFREMTSDADRAGAVGFWGALFLAVTPLFWITGLRPMSDMFGLGVALAAQALLLHGACGADLVPASAEASAGHRSLGKGGRSANQSLIIGAAIAGLAAGIRTQTVPLTVPMLLYALFMQRRRGLWLLRPLAAFVVAALAWGIPLLVLTGGVDGYLRALGSQAGEDFAWVDMLWANPSPRAIAVAVYDSFLLPFATPVAGAIVLGVVAIAKLRMLFNDRRALLLLAVAFGPYTVFHLLFQEAANLRYATPLVPAFAFGAAFLVCSLDGRRAWPQRGLLVALPLVVLLVVPNIATGSARIGDIPLAAGFVYGREVHPAFRAIDEMTLQAKGNPPGAVFSHYSLRRPLQAAPTSLPVIEATRTYEWLALADYWLKGGREPLWFLADPTRTDLALIDPQVRQAEQRTEYRWSVGDRPELMGTRPLGVDWYRFGQPAWFAGEGWELTPETAGIARASNKRLYQQPITAYIRRMNEPMAAIIAGRHLGPPTLPSSILDVTIDGMPVESIPIDPAKNGIDFFHLVTLPQGIGPGTGNYAELTIRARSAAAGTPTPEIAVEQFDIQPVSTVMFAFGAGWHEAEYNNRTGLAWRWTSDKADLRIVGPGPVSIQLRGESPMKYVTTPPNVHVRAGDRRLARFHPTADFTWDVVVPADALESSGGIVTIETDQIYLPGQAEGTADARRLGLRIFDTRVRRTE
jgi:hypothetical protein